ncbi:MAG: carbohydrate ABC transporter permease [Planctomycetota bacterium]
MAAGNNRPAGGKWCVVLVWLIALAMLLPFAQTVWLAQKPRRSIDRGYHHLARRLPEREVRRKIRVDPRPLRVALINSIIVSTACSFLAVVIASMAGYAFAKKRFRGKALLFDLVLAAMALPAAILMVPLFRLTVAMHIYDTMAGLILPFAVTGFGIFYMRYAISAVPDGLVHCARLDGLSEAGALFRVVLPAIWPSVVTLAVLQFIASWNSFVLPHAIIASPENYTIGILLGRLMHDFQGLMWNDIMIVVIAGLVPVLVIFLVFSRWVLRGATAIGDDRSVEH